MASRLLPIILLVLISASVWSAPESPKTNKKWLLTMKSGTGEILRSISAIPKSSMDRTNRLQKLVGSLKAHAATSQKQIVDILNQEVASRRGGFSFENLWISNQIILRGADAQLIEKLSGRPDVAHIVPDFAFQLDPSEAVTSNLVQRKLTSPRADVTSWGIDKIEVPQVWAKGYNGNGVIVATIDSGAQLNHEALEPRYVGQANFGWYDPIESSTSPFDDLGHGTHTMGTIVGYFKDASGEARIGIAPGAQWMACKGCTGDNYCWASDVESCFQFLLCPRGQDGGECDPSKAPHVINNSYFIDYVNRAGTRDDLVESALDALQAAGIVMVFSIGNAYNCESAGYPGDYKNVIGVGSTTSNDDLSSFSSSGPGLTHGTAEIKPEIVAPGSNIVSSVVGSGHDYGSKSGTSMAGPHVAGVVALMLSKNIDLEVAQVRQILFNTTELMGMSESRNCGGIPDTQFPNFSLGYGRINALTAVDSVAEP